jgi:hypothetical protein
VDVELEPGAARTAMRELASLGLPIHVSELDISTDGRWDRDVALKQARVAEEVVGALLDLPPAQRLGLTLWGARDGDSWLARRDRGERPLLFDDAGEPKPAAEAARALLRFHSDAKGVCAIARLRELHRSTTLRRPDVQQAAHGGDGRLEGNVLSTRGLIRTSAAMASMAARVSVHARGRRGRTRRRDADLR